MDTITLASFLAKVSWNMKRQLCLGFQESISFWGLLGFNQVGGLSESSMIGPNNSFRGYFVSIYFLGSNWDKMH